MGELRMPGEVVHGRAARAHATRARAPLPSGSRPPRKPKLLGLAAADRFELPLQLGLQAPALAEQLLLQSFALG